MKTKLTAFMVSVGALVGGLLIGWVSARPVAALVDELNLYINAGTEAGTATMTCGWHSQCLPGNLGNDALDWGQPGSWPVHFHSWATYLGYATSAGSGLASQNDGNCQRVRVDVNRPNGTDLGDVYYTHTNSAQGGTFTIGAGPLGSPYWTSWRVATTVAANMELGNCPGGLPNPHIHQSASSLFGRNTGMYASYPPENAIADVDITSQSTYQNYMTYQY